MNLLVSPRRRPPHICAAHKAATLRISASHAHVGANWADVQKVAAGGSQSIQYPQPHVPGSNRVWGDGAVSVVGATVPAFTLSKCNAPLPCQREKRLPGVYLSKREKSSLCAQMGHMPWRLKSRLRAFRHQVPLQGLPSPVGAAFACIVRLRLCAGASFRRRRRWRSRASHVWVGGVHAGGLGAMGP